MIIHCKNTLGDGTVIYVDYDVPDQEPAEEDTDATAEDYEAALVSLGVEM